MEDVLTVLEFVHAQGVIHRDIKPENLIRRQSDGKFVLIDFGAVKTIGNTVAEATGETSLSVPIYTSGYGASEQCLGGLSLTAICIRWGWWQFRRLRECVPPNFPMISIRPK